MNSRINPDVLEIIQRNGGMRPLVRPLPSTEPLWAWEALCVSLNAAYGFSRVTGSSADDASRKLAQLLLFLADCPE